jgi:hypothetical protein
MIRRSFIPRTMAASSWSFKLPVYGRLSDGFSGGVLMQRF